MYYVYVIQNENGKIYIGQTDDLKRRILRHNGILSSKVKSFTNINKGNWQVVYKEKYETRGEALLREKQLKSHKGRDWIKNVIVRARSSTAEQ